MNDTAGSSALAIIEQPRMTLIPAEQTSNSAMALAKLAAASGLCKTQKQADAFFIIMYGYELGIPAMTALRTIHTISNTPVCSGEAMLALIRRSGKVEVKITGDDQSATVYMKRRDTGEEYSTTWTIERGNRAGLVSKNGSNWGKFPRAMMQWRGVSECAKFLCSDIVGGLYTIEEIAPDTPVNESGEAVGEIVITVPEKWFEMDNGRALHEMSERAFTAGLIKERNGKGVAEMEAMLAPKTWADYADRASAAGAIKEIVEARRQAAAQSTGTTQQPEPDTPTITAPDSPFAAPANPTPAPEPEILAKPEDLRQATRELAAMEAE
jgi:hypothetical protein